MDEIKAIIHDILENNELNYLHNLTGQRIFDQPLLGVADGFDPLFKEYKKQEVIGEFHLTPKEILSNINSDMVYQPDRGISVICWILPFHANIKKANARKEVLPSIRWSQSYIQGEEINNIIRKTLETYFLEQGILACAPVLSDQWQEVESSHGYASSWSERHALYAAGLGTFSINNALITDKGIAHRCGSIVVNSKLPVSTRKYNDHMGNCLYMVNGSCGKCMDRCPAFAITRKGLDKVQCRSYREKIYSEVLSMGSEVPKKQGCGLCQCGVPCESRNPMAKKQS